MLLGRWHSLIGITDSDRLLGIVFLILFVSIFSVRIVDFVTILPSTNIAYHDFACHDDYYDSWDR